MPAVDQQKSRSCYVWAIAIFLFLSVTAGGIFLGLYMIEPETTPDSPNSNTGWYPYAGVTLVSLPWFFWILTLLYRVTSRAFGFRMVCWDTSPSDSEPTAAASSTTGATAGGDTRDIINTRRGGGETAASMEEGTRPVSTPTSVGGDGGRKVKFGEAVVLGEENDRNKNESASPLSARSNDSQDSEAPFRYAMAS